MIPITKEEDPSSGEWIQLAKKDDNLLVSTGREWFVQDSIEIPPNRIPMLINALLELTATPFNQETN